MISCGEVRVQEWLDSPAGVVGVWVQSVLTDCRGRLAASCWLLRSRLLAGVSRFVLLINAVDETVLQKNVSPG